MALLDICEYPGTPVPTTVHQKHFAGQEPALAFQQITYTGTAAQSAALSANTRLVRIVTDGIARIRISAAGTAVTAATGFRVSAGVPEYFNVTPGHVISAIVATP